LYTFVAINVQHPRLQQQICSKNMKAISFLSDGYSILGFPSMPNQMTIGAINAYSVGFFDLNRRHWWSLFSFSLGRSLAADTSMLAWS